MHRDFEESRDRGLVGFGITALGMLCLAGGVALTRYAFLGRVARFAAAEIAPAARDTIRVVGPAIGEGIARGIRAARDAQAEDAGRKCASCGAENDSDARFCDGCGTPLDDGPACPSCGAENDADAHFCDSCGKPLRA